MIPGKKAKGHRSLTNNLDSKILNYVREHTQVQLHPVGDSKPLGVSQLYNLLQAQDSQLRRLKKVQLEASIQRALNILRTEIVIDSDGESFDSDFEGIEDLNLVEVKVLNIEYRVDGRIPMLLTSSLQVNGLLINLPLHLETKRPRRT